MQRKKSSSSHGFHRSHGEGQRSAIPDPGAHPAQEIATDRPDPRLPYPNAIAKGNPLSAAYQYPGATPASTVMYGGFPRRGRLWTDHNI